MSVKDVLQSLVDDGLVDSDRIGTSNYFWAFPSKAANIVSDAQSSCPRDSPPNLPPTFSPAIMMILSQSKKKLRELEEKLDEIKQKKLHLSSELSQVQVGREESEERAGMLVALGERQAQRIKLAKELEQYKSCDPQTLRELREYIVFH